jgi:hypothetical protein
VNESNHFATRGRMGNGRIKPRNWNDRDHSNHMLNMMRAIDEAVIRR